MSEPLAQEIIAQIGSCTDCPINVMNENGTIIASSDNDRIGTFHEAAYEMLKTNTELAEVTDTQALAGVQPGINMCLQYKGQNIGVLGVTGDVAKLRPIALVLKKSAELLLECEFNRVGYTRRQDAKTLMQNYLMYVDVDSTLKATVSSLCKSLGYREDIPRIVLLISTPDTGGSKRLAAYLKENVSKSSQDIVFRDNQGNIVIFLAYRENLDGFFSSYKYTIGEYLQNFLSRCRSGELPVRICAGPMESDWSNYKYAYEKALWIHDNIHPGQPGGFYFYEHMDEYLKSRLPLVELHKIFGSFAGSFSEKFIESFVKHIGVLYDNNYSFQKSSDQLYIHKNTLAFRIDKIRNRLGIDPIQNMKDRELTEYLYYYLRHSGKNTF